VQDGITTFSNSAWEVMRSLRFRFSIFAMSSLNDSGTHAGNRSVSLIIFCFVASSSLLS
jgi:hypothetical protein